MIRLLMLKKDDIVLRYDDSYFGKLLPLLRTHNVYSLLANSGCKNVWCSSYHACSVNDINCTICGIVAVTSIRIKHKELK